MPRASQVTSVMTPRWRPTASTAGALDRGAVTWSMSRSAPGSVVASLSTGACTAAPRGRLERSGTSSSSPMGRCAAAVGMAAWRRCPRGPRWRASPPNGSKPARVRASPSSTRRSPARGLPWPRVMATPSPRRCSRPPVATWASALAACSTSSRRRCWCSAAAPSRRGRCCWTRCTPPSRSRPSRPPWSTRESSWRGWARIQASSAPWSGRGGSCRAGRGRARVLPSA